MDFCQVKTLKIVWTLIARIGRVESIWKTEAEPNAAQFNHRLVLIEPVFIANHLCPEALKPCPQAIDCSSFPGCFGFLVSHALFDAVQHGSHNYRTSN